MAVPESPQDGLEGSLFSLDQADVAYQPRRVAGFCPDTIELARGSGSDSIRKRLAEQICRVYPRHIAILSMSSSVAGRTCRSGYALKKAQHSKPLA